MAENNESPAIILSDTSHTISPSGNLEISVLSSKDANGQRTRTRFIVDAKALKAHSDYFQASLRFNEKTNHTVVLKDDDPGAIRVWLIYIHAAAKYNNIDTAMDTSDTDKPARKINQEEELELFESPGVQDTDIARIWHIVNACDKYIFDPSLLPGFFEHWFAKNVNLDSLHDDLARELALPCYMFNHAKGFATVTKWLAYNFAGHITEKRPRGFKWKHMHMCPPDFVGPMNHARGGLKTVLHKGIWHPVDKLLKEGKSACSCDSWDATCGRYFAELVRIDAYPLELVFPKNSVNEILAYLEAFSASSLQPLGNCRLCSRDWSSAIAKAIANTTTNFDGLCIDCMDRSLFKHSAHNEEYWKECGSSQGRFDKDCRIHHGQQTWYVSWLGRGEHRQKLLEEHRKRNLSRPLGGVLF